MQQSPAEPLSVDHVHDHSSFISPVVKDVLWMCALIASLAYMGYAAWSLNKGVKTQHDIIVTHAPSVTDEDAM